MERAVGEKRSSSPSTSGVGAAGSTDVGRNGVGGVTKGDAGAKAFKGGRRIWIALLLFVGELESGEAAIPAARGVCSTRGGEEVVKASRETAWIPSVGERQP
jgi:hypothetical protein